MTPAVRTAVRSTAGVADAAAVGLDRALAARTAPPRRIHVIGGPGSGKTTLAVALGAALGVPVHHLDEVARVGGGTGRVRSAAERDPHIDAILAADAWIVEGVHLGWTEPFLARADLIVWLEAATGAAAARRIAGRFLAGGRAEFRRRSWRERMTAVPGSVRHARDALGAMVAARRYAAAGADRPVDPGGTLDSRAAADAALRPHRERVVHLASHAQADAFLATLAAAHRGPAGPGGTAGC